MNNSFPITKKGRLNISVDLPYEVPGGFEPPYTVLQTAD